MAFSRGIKTWSRLIMDMREDLRVVDLNDRSSYSRRRWNEHKRISEWRLANVSGSINL